MKIYRVGSHYESDKGCDEGHVGYDYFTSRRAAGAHCRMLRTSGHIKIEVQSRDVPLTRRGVLLALKAWGGHAENG